MLRREYVRERGNIKSHGRARARDEYVADASIEFSAAQSIGDGSQSIVENGGIRTQVDRWHTPCSLHQLAVACFSSSDPH